MARVTVAELLAKAKKKRDKIQKKAIQDVEDLIPPILGPAGRAAPTIARGITELENVVMDYALDRIADEIGHIPIGPGPKRSKSSTFDPNNPITRFLEERLEFSPPVRTRKPRVRSDKQLVNDEIQSIALKEINVRARKKDGSFKKGWDQRKVMRLAQKECTKERERLGLCKRKSTRKGQVRKTARRAYKK